MLPEDATKRAAPQVERALRFKLAKLSDAKAHYKVLLVELPTQDTSPTTIVNLIKNSSSFTPQLERIDFVVVAKTLTDQGTGAAWFFAYDTHSYRPGDIGCVTWP